MIADIKRQEQVVNDAFSKQSAFFDDIYEHNAINLWMRNKARNEALKFLKAGDNMLELNCGTGIDTMFFAQKGFTVHATDNADGMLKHVSEKVASYGMQNNITVQKCSFNDLSQLGGRKFDYIFSNFSGLNCTDDLAKVLRDIDTVLQPGGTFTFVIMPRVCPWELLMALKGNFKTAFRRFKKNGTSAHIEGVYFRCYYYNPSYVLKNIGSNFELLSLAGLASFVPPPFMENFPEHHPRLFRILEKIENAVCKRAPFTSWCDQYAITMRKKG